MSDLSMFVPNVHFEQIPIKNLVSNQQYQRNLSERHVLKAAEHFDLHQVNPVKVSRRNGVNFVFNGQHTIEIIALVSGSRETPVWCMVYDDLDYELEADIFANQQKYVKPLIPYETFIANVEAGNDKQIVIKDLVESYGLSIAKSACPGGIVAVSSLESIYDKMGYQVLDRVLMLAVGTWEGEKQSLCANMLNGLARLISCFGDELKDTVFKEKLSVVSLREISRTAKERRGGTRGYSEALLEYYNKRMKGPLKWEKLYAHKSPGQQVKHSNTASPQEIDTSSLADMLPAETSDSTEPAGQMVLKEILAYTSEPGKSAPH